jgi:hypothetical protein
MPHTCAPPCIFTSHSPRLRGGVLQVQHILHSALDIAMQVGVSALEPSHLSGVDMLHYLGTEALEVGPLWTPRSSLMKPPKRRQWTNQVLCSTAPPPCPRLIALPSFSPPLQHFADRVAKLPRRPLQEEGPVCEEGGPIVVDIGAGVGGPARFLAHKWRCNVLAYEFNPDFCRAGRRWRWGGL